jgi:hypothetical protein
MTLAAPLRLPGSELTQLSIPRKIPRTPLLTGGALFVKAILMKITGKSAR